LDFTTANWQFAGIPTAYQEDDVVLFDDTATVMTVNLATTVIP